MEPTHTHSNSPTSGLGSIAERPWNRFQLYQRIGDTAVFRFLSPEYSADPIQRRKDVMRWVTTASRTAITIMPPVRRHQLFHFMTAGDQDLQIIVNNYENRAA